MDSSFFPPAGGGGSGGTTDYNDLSNRPIINVMGEDIDLSRLSTGVYNIKGTFKVCADDEPHDSGGDDDLFYVTNDADGLKATRVSAGASTLYTLPVGGTASDIQIGETATIEKISEQLVSDF